MFGKSKQENPAEKYQEETPNPLAARQQLDGFLEDEREAFNWVMDKIQLKHPGWDTQTSVNEAIDLGWFFVDDDGQLRVSKERGSEI